MPKRDRKLRPDKHQAKRGFKGRVDKDGIYLSVELRPSGLSDRRYWG